MRSLPFSYLLYRLIMIAISPMLFIWLWRNTDNADQRANRLGKIKQKVVADIWLHCASVGEVNAVIPLVVALTARDKKLLITCFTSTGLAQAQRRLQALGLAETVTCLLLPIDWQWTTSRFLKQVQVAELWLIETEFWPTLIMNAKRHGIRLKLVNGRLSAKTLNAPRWWRHLLAHLLTYQIGTCLLRSEQDKAYYMQLGVMPEKLQITGNLKLCDLPVHAPERLYAQAYIVFASTHAPEEEQLAQLWQKNPMLPKLIIVPRHPKRGKKIAERLQQLGVLASQRSIDPQQHKGVIIADTFGELQSWMAFAELVIMGGSFAPKGGQNPIEPARLGKSILTGPDMQDFADETQALSLVGTLTQHPAIDDAFIQQIKNLLKTPDQLVQRGIAGQTWLINTQQTVMSTTLSALFPTGFSQPAVCKDNL